MEAVSTSFPPETVPENRQEIPNRLYPFYHEGCALLIKENSIKIWDPSAGWWVDPLTVKGYGSVLAIRIDSKEPVDRFQWGTHSIPSNSWVNLKDQLDVFEQMESV